MTWGCNLPFQKRNSLLIAYHDSRIRRKRKAYNARIRLPRFSSAGVGCRLQTNEFDLSSCSVLAATEIEFVSLKHTADAYTRRMWRAASASLTSNDQHLTRFEYTKPLFRSVSTEYFCIIPSLDSLIGPWIDLTICLWPYWTSTKQRSGEVWKKVQSLHLKLSK